MTLKEKYEKCLQDSENFITGEKNNASCSYKYGKRLAQFFNEELDYSDMNIHYGYPIGGIRKEDWNLKIRFQLRKPEIERYSPLGSGQVFKYLSTLADSDWTSNEPIDSEAKEIMRGMLDMLSPVQEGLTIKHIGVEWALHVPDCTTVFVTFFYAYDEEEEIATD